MPRSYEPATDDWADDLLALELLTNTSARAEVSTDVGDPSSWSSRRSRCFSSCLSSGAGFLGAPVARATGEGRRAAGGGQGQEQEQGGGVATEVSSLLGQGHGASRRAEQAGRRRRSRCERGAARMLGCWIGCWAGVGCNFGFLFFIVQPANRVLGV
jgi:hypothetical protein